MARAQETELEVAHAGRGLQLARTVLRLSLLLLKLLLRLLLLQLLLRHAIRGCEDFGIIHGARLLLLLLLLIVELLLLLLMLLRVRACSLRMSELLHIWSSRSAPASRPSGGRHGRRLLLLLLHDSDGRYAVAVRWWSQ